ncbi:MAG TPA: AraC family transcriptional regulator [Chitinophagaceae bacterium]
MKKERSFPATFHFEYCDEAFESLFSAFKKQAASVYDDRILKLSHNFGEGTVRFFPVEEGFCLYYHDYKLNGDISVHRKANSTGKRFYQLHYILDDLTQNVLAEKNITSLKVGCKILFPSNAIESAHNYRAGSNVKVVSLLFSSEWLEKNKVLPTDQLKELIEGLEKNSPLLLDKMNIADHDIANNLHRSIEAGQCTSLKIRANCLLLINSYFANLASQDRLSLTKNSSFHLPEIAKIEAEVCDHLETMLPELKNLAVQFHMSASTLKRHFKAVYGKNIYQYYLEKKMGLAKDLLKNEELSIADIAYTLGYEKAGSLTTAFKKVYGLAPRDIKVG